MSWTTLRNTPMIGCGCGVRMALLHNIMWINVWVAGKTVSFLVDTFQPERFRDDCRTHYKALHKYLIDCLL